MPRPPLAKYDSGSRTRFQEFVKGQLAKYRISLNDLERVADSPRLSLRTIQNALQPGGNLPGRTALALLRRLRLAGAMKDPTEVWFQFEEFHRGGTIPAKTLSPFAKALIGDRHALTSDLADRACALVGIPKSMKPRLVKAFDNYLCTQIAELASAMGPDCLGRISMYVVDRELAYVKETIKRFEARIDDYAATKSRRSRKRKAR